MNIAGVQMDVSLGQIDANLEKMAAFLRQTSSAGARLTVFPECAATGCCFPTAWQKPARSPAHSRTDYR